MSQVNGMVVSPQTLSLEEPSACLVTCELLVKVAPIRVAKVSLIRLVLAPELISTREIMLQVDRKTNVALT